ncbi:KTSC domain-containing protein [Texcoconibacillus texcoconensis]|uniref:KTSC domain-containing protein n=1 Tax=Texcoconibacillus texcoconensis TaxID=1095777 RepID=A0A840QSV6_9BACI|nr:KTSC domain-containing protein [Texcoconibacillus texcoconensis]MBB5174371.1 hypothetical protein [Texcoconibacillus texcoconensis]
METTTLNDSLIKKVSYDEQTRALHVHFQDGRYIVYYEVFKLDYVGLLSSENYGDYFKEKIEPRFPSKNMKD